MNAKKVSNHATEHTVAMAYELLSNDQVSGEDLEETLLGEGIGYRKLISILKTNHETEWMVEPLKAFYEAMKKVIPHLEYPDHSGTEDRGWYRVFGDIHAPNNFRLRYFCSMDFYRDAWMAETFLKHEAITQQHYNEWRTRSTLRMLAESNGDASKMAKSCKPESLTKVFDIRLLLALSNAPMVQEAIEKQQTIDALTTDNEKQIWPAWV